LVAYLQKFDEDGLLLILKSFALGGQYGEYIADGLAIISDELEIARKYDNYMKMQAHVRCILFFLFLMRLTIVNKKPMTNDDNNITQYYTMYKIKVLDTVIKLIRSNYNIADDSYTFLEEIKKIKEELQFFN